jgi:hypothetical protein
VKDSKGSSIAIPSKNAATDGSPDKSEGQLPEHHYTGTGHHVGAHVLVLSGGLSAVELSEGDDPLVNLAQLQQLCEEENPYEQ